MTVDTTLMRAPFFEVRVGPPDAQNNDFVSLPQEIHGLISSFEFVQVIDGGQGSASRATLVFAEGSGYAGNAPGVDSPGSVMDLVFSKHKGVHFVDPEVLRTGNKNKEEALTDDDIINADKQADTVLKKSIRDNNKRIKEEKEKSKSPIFLLQERNVIEITWGYRNNGSVSGLSTRIMRGTIQRITHRASENGMPTTELMILDMGSGEFHKLEPNVGVNFTRGLVNQILTGEVDTNTSPVNKALNSQPAGIESMFNAIAKRFIPNAIANVQLDEEDSKKDTPDQNRIWSINTSLHEFLKGEAEKIFAHYYVSTHPKSKKTIINLVSRSLFEKDRGADFTFVWKQGIEVPSNLKTFATMKSFSLSLFPEGGSGASSRGICSKRKVMVGDTKQTVSRRILGDTNTPVTLIQTDPKLKELTNSSGIARYEDSCESNIHQASAETFSSRLDRALRIDFVTVGVPGLSPGMVELKNIGLRYSGMYSAISVTHKISASTGYVCNVTATTNVIKSGGVTNKSSRVKNKESAPVTYKVREDGTPGPVEKVSPNPGKDGTQ